MKLSELIEHVGDDNIVFQNLDSDADGCEIKKGVGRFTFRTDPAHVKERVTGNPSHVAFVVWIPRERLPQ